MSRKLGPRGFRVEHPLYAVHWVIAESAAKARWSVYSTAREFGFPVEIGHFHVRRCPAIDGMRTIDPPMRPVAIVHSSEIRGAYWDKWLDSLHHGYVIDRPVWEQETAA